jgi:Protein of unknown function (DUF3344)
MAAPATATPQDATGDLSTVSVTTLHGGYVAAGIGMRNLGYGTITISGVPDGARVKSATLLWDIVADAPDATFAQGKIGGHAVSGTAEASGASPCWDEGSGNYSYEANVTKLVTGNGAYSLTGFATGEDDGADPWTVGSTAPLLEGASLVVVYQLASMPSTVVQIAAGASEIADDTGSAQLTGFTAGAQAKATTTYIVGDGQHIGAKSATFNGTIVPDTGFTGSDPQAVPSYSQGDLWDTTTADVSSSVKPGDTSASLSVTSATADGYYDCVVWVGQVLAVSRPTFTISGSDKSTLGQAGKEATGSPKDAKACETLRGQAKYIGAEVLGAEAIEKLQDLGFTNAWYFLAHFLGGTGAPINLPNTSLAASEIKNNEAFTAENNNVLKYIKQRLDSRVTHIKLPTPDPLHAFAFLSLLRGGDLYFAFRRTHEVQVTGGGSTVGEHYVGWLKYEISESYGFNADNKLLDIGPPMRYLQTICGAPYFPHGAHWFKVTVTITESFSLPR